MTTPATVPVVEPTAPTPIRYYGLVASPSLASNHDVPFVLENLAEARELIAAVRDGRQRVWIREWVSGTVVEQETSFYGAQSEEVSMLLYSVPPSTVEDAYPDYQLRIGPRGGVVCERA